MNKKDWIKNNLPTILTMIGCVGTLVTAGLGIKAGMRIADICEDDEIDEIDKKDVIKACTPVIISSVVTIGCGVSADILNRKAKSDLFAMCALIGSSYSGYRKEVINRYGAEVDKEIVDTVCEYSECMYMAPDIPDKKVHWIIDMCDERIPIYELDAYERDIINAERHLNRNYIFSGAQSLGNFLEFLEILGSGRTRTDISDMFGWAINDHEIYYIDFEHKKIDDKTFKIHPIFAPWYRYDELDMFGNEY